MRLLIRTMDVKVRQGPFAEKPQPLSVAEVPLDWQSLLNISGMTSIALVRGATWALSSAP